MKTNLIILAALLPFALCAAAQTAPDTLIDRSVTVEREFQPTIQSAGKLMVTPKQYEAQTSGTPVVYSHYSQSLNTVENISTLGHADTRFNNLYEGKNGFLQAGIGHANSLLNFRYVMTDNDTRKNGANFGVQLNHTGQWGRKMFERTAIGVDFNKAFDPLVFYFDANGGNEYYTRYGRYYDPATDGYTTLKSFKDFTDRDKQSLWKINAHVGVRSLPNADITYRVQTGYEAVAASTAMEHQIHTIGEVGFHVADVHHVGLQIDVQNRFYSVKDTTLHPITNHYFHIAPYYEASFFDRLHLHAGVNLDIAAGHKRLFGASPDVHVEFDITKTWLAVYAEAKGGYDAPGIRGYMRENHFLSIPALMNDSLGGAYTPVDAALGLKIRPIGTMLIDVHAGYKMILGDEIYTTFLPGAMPRAGMGNFLLTETDAQCWRFGGSFHYHYQDIVKINLTGDYFVWNMRDLNTKAWHGLTYDRPSWQIRLRVDGRINQRWALYSDNFFCGSRRALVLDAADHSKPYGGDADAFIMRPAVDLNLGVEYSMNSFLSLYAQLNNYLAWTNRLNYDIYYGYKSQGVNCMLGVVFRF